MLRVKNFIVKVLNPFVYGEQMLKIQNLFKSYGKKQVLKGANFVLNDGELKGLIGVNGSGKTTLIECVCGVKKFDSGEIKIDGLDIKNRANKTKLKYTFGYMPQRLTMFNDLSVRENLAYFASVYNLPKNRIDEIIEICGLGQYQKTLAQNLSGGYRQLLSLAGAIIHSPKLLILDEPTSAMDPLFRIKFWEIIHTYHKSGSSILLITHYVEELNECENFMCLSNGVIAFDGKTKTLQKNGMVDITEVLKHYSGEAK